MQGELHLRRGWPVRVTSAQGGAYQSTSCRIQVYYSHYTSLIGGRVREKESSSFLRASTFWEKGFVTRQMIYWNALKCLMLTDQGWLIFCYLLVDRAWVCCKSCISDITGRKLRKSDGKRRNTRWVRLFESSSWSPPWNQSIQLVDLSTLMKKFMSNRKFQKRFAVPFDFDIVVLFAWRCILVHHLEDLCTMKWIALVSGSVTTLYSCAVVYWYRGSWTLQCAAVGNWLCWTDCVSAVFCCRLARIDSLESCTQLEEKMFFAVPWCALAAIAAWLVRWVQTINLQELTVSHQQPPVEAPLQAPHLSAFDSRSSKPSIHMYSVF